MPEGAADDRRQRDERRRAMVHIMGDLNESNKRLAQQRTAMLHILQDSHRDKLHLEASRKAMIHIMGDLRRRRTRAGKKRVLRLMREGRLLAPPQSRHAHGDRTHFGTIRTHRPDELWGTDATLCYTRRDGWWGFFGAIDHCVEDIVGWHVAKVGDRWAALEPIRQGVRQTHRGYAPKVALDLGLRMDRRRSTRPISSWASSGPGRVMRGRPECNRIMERWIRTLKDECLYLHDFATLEEARQVIGEFIERYNCAWLLERHGYRTPADIRRALTRQAA